MSRSVVMAYSGAEEVTLINEESAECLIFIQEIKLEPGLNTNEQIAAESLTISCDTHDLQVHNFSEIKEKRNVILALLKQFQITSRRGT